MYHIRVALLVAFLMSGLLAACGGGSGGAVGATAPGQKYQITGSLTGLSAGDSLALSVNGQVLGISQNGGFTTNASFISGAPYAVAVKAEPAGETCTIANGSGTVGTANVTNIQVACTSNPAQTFTIGGTVSGMTSGTLVLQDNGGDNLSITSGGAFTFAKALFNQAAYDVTILSQPTGQTCTVSNGSGTVPGANVTAPVVTCAASSPQTFSIGGAIVGLSGSVALQEAAGGSVQTFTAYGPFAFSTALAGGAGYDVTVATQPTGQTCAVSGGSGTVGTSNVNSITVSCSSNPAYSIGGSVSGLNSGASVALVDNGSDTLAVSTNGAFTFAQPLPSGSSYNITVSVEPLHQVCAVTNGTGTVNGAGVTSIAVACTAGPQYAYVANSNGANVSAYRIDASTGALTPIAGSPFPAGSDPNSVAISPNGAFAYVANSVGANVSAYRIDASTGALTPIPGSPFAAGSYPYSVAISPNGAFAYVANASGGNVSAYRIDASTGALTPIPGSPFAAGSDPNSVAISPNGAFAYVANALGANVSAYIIDASTGALTPIPGSPFAAGIDPIFVAVQPTSNLVFAANYLGDSVSGYSINSSTGALTLLGSTAAGSAPNSIAFNPTGTLEFVTNANSNTVSVYPEIGTAVLSFPTGSNPSSVAIAWP